MSQATDLLNSIPPAYTTTSETEPHIVIGNDRFITVPEELKRIAVQYDHGIETVTFDCPRYWDEHDMSEMRIYVNYMRSDGEKGSDLCTNVVVDENDETMMHFDWTVTGHLSAINGPVVFLVCIQRTSGDLKTENHWNSELNTDLFVSEGLEIDASLHAVYPGIVEELLIRMENVDQKTTDEAMVGYVETFIDENPEEFEEIVGEHADEYMKVNAQSKVDDYMDRNVGYHISKYVGEYAEVNTITYENLPFPKVGYFGPYGPHAQLEVGEVCTRNDILSNHVEKEARTYCTILDVAAGDVIELQYPLSTGDHTHLSPYIVVTDMNDVVIKVVHSGNVAEYINDLGLFEHCFTKDCHVYIQSEFPVGPNGGNLVPNNDTVMIIHSKTFDFSKMATKNELKPYFINMDKIDVNDPTVGEAVIDAFFAGRTLIVTDSAQDPGVDQRGYRFVQWVGLPRNGWNMVELKLSDGSSINLAATTRTGDNPYEEYENN